MTLSSIWTQEGTGTSCSLSRSARLPNEHTLTESSLPGTEEKLLGVKYVFKVEILTHSCRCNYRLFIEQLTNLIVKCKGHPYKHTSLQPIISYYMLTLSYSEGIYIDSAASVNPFYQTCLTACISTVNRKLILTNETGLLGVRKARCLSSRY